MYKSYRSYIPHPNYVHTNITNTIGDQFRVYISDPKTWKGTKGRSDISNNVTDSVGATNSRPPLIPVSGSGFLYRRGKASAAPNPIKHWRRQLQPDQGSRTGRVCVGQIMDRPGGSVVLTYYQTVLNNSTDCNQCQPFLPTYILENYVRPLDPANCFQKTTNLYGMATTVPNVICNPARIRRPATTNISKKYYTTGKAYLRSRVKLLVQNQTLSKITGNTYTTPSGQNQPIAANNYVPPTNSKTTGSQLYNSVNCIEDASSCCLPTNCQIQIIYKPSNYLFSVDGGVSSSARIARLKYDAIQRNNWQTKVLLADTLIGSTPQIYNVDTDAPYFVKSKYQQVDTCNPTGYQISTHSRARTVSKRMPAGGTGLKTVCFPVQQ